MPRIPWTPGTAADTNGEAIVLVSRLEVRSRLQTVGFIRASNRVREQLAETDGLIGFSLIAHPIRREFFTLSSWVSQEAVDRFVATEPHRTIMRTWEPRLSSARFMTFTIDAEQRPTWRDALARLDAEASTSTTPVTRQ